MEVPRFKELRRAYGFDEVAIVPGDVTVNPDQTIIDFTIADYTFPIPFLASSLDAVVSPQFAICLGQMGGLGVLNLEGIYTRYEDPTSAIQHIIEASQEEATPLLQKIYSAPIREDLVGQRIQEIKEGGVICAVFPHPGQHQTSCAHYSRSRRGHPVHPVDSNYGKAHFQERAGSGPRGSLPAGAPSQWWWETASATARPWS